MKTIKLFLLAVMLVCMTGCQANAKEAEYTPTQQHILDESKEINIGEIADIRPIEFSNEHVEDYTLDKNFPILSTFKPFQNQTTLTVKCNVSGTITYDANQIKVVEKRSKYEVTLPTPKIHTWIDADSLSADNYYYTSDKWWGSKKFSSEEQAQALEEIEKNVQDTYLKDEKRLDDADVQMKAIITDALNNYNKLQGTSKEVKFM